MRLASVDIAKMLEMGVVGVNPAPTEDRVGGCSLDLRLGYTFRVPTGPTPLYIDIADQEDSSCSRLVTMEEGEPFYLAPGKLVLGATLEAVSLPDYMVGVLDGRSSLARLGLLVHLTAHTVDPGWSGNITLELLNVGKSTLLLRPGMRVCAIGFELLTSRAVGYSDRKGSKYVNQRGPVESRINREHRHKDYTH